MYEMGRGGMRGAQPAVLGDAAAPPRLPLAMVSVEWSGARARAALTPACVAPSQSCKTCCPASSTSWAPTTWPTSRSSPRPTREEARTARCKRLATVWALASAPNASPALVPSGLLEGPGLNRGLTILRGRHPLTPAARAQTLSETTLHRQPAARRERG